MKRNINSCKARQKQPNPSVKKEKEKGEGGGGLVHGAKGVKEAEEPALWKSE